jgi:hypothetical protein
MSYSCRLTRNVIFDQNSTAFPFADFYEAYKSSTELCTIMQNFGAWVGVVVKALRY